tara:strand:- start:160 stop:831 length:672 start_codon:yes stop_codon:yes gene_type:complete
MTIFCGVLSVAGAALLFRPRFVSWVGRHIWGPVLLRILGVRLTVKHNDKVNFDKPNVFFMNHQSTIDILVAFTVVPSDIYFVAKKELKWLPFVGWAMQVGGMIFVDRSSPTKAVESMSQAAEQVRNGKNIIVYPEGTRSKDGKLRPFKKGAFVTAMQAQVDCVPMAVQGAFDVMGPSVLNIVPGPVTLSFGEPISTAATNYQDNKDRLAVSQQGEAAIRNLLE